MPELTYVVEWSDHSYCRYYDKPSLIAAILRKASEPDSIYPISVAVV